MAPIPYIRTIDGPNGHVRPIPGGVQYWETPAIWIHNPSAPLQGKAVAVADAAQVVMVEVGNLGDADAAVDDLIVQVWASGFGTVSGFAPTLEGVARPNTNPVPAGSPGVAVPITWEPQTSDLGGLPSRHFCILANVFLASNPGEQLADGHLVNVPAQIRHGQKNMTLVAKGTNARGFSFAMATANPDAREPGDFAFEIVEVFGPLEPPEVFHIEDSLWVVRSEEGERLTLRGSDGKTEVRPTEDRPVRHLALELGDQSGTRLEARYAPAEERPVTMRLEFGDDEDGLIRRFDVLQHGVEGLVGAARVITVSVPEELLEPGNDEPGQARY